MKTQGVRFASVQGERKTDHARRARLNIPDKERVRTKEPLFNYAVSRLWRWRVSRSTVHPSPIPQALLETWIGHKISHGRCWHVRRIDTPKIDATDRRNASVRWDGDILQVDDKMPLPRSSCGLKSVFQKIILSPARLINRCLDDASRQPIPPHCKPTRRVAVPVHQITRCRTSYPFFLLQSTPFRELEGLLANRESFRSIVGHREPQPHAHAAVVKILRHFHRSAVPRDFNLAFAKRT